MEHCRDETLALLALGEPVGSTQLSEHLNACAPCRSRLDDLTRTVAVARSVAVGDPLMLPPAELWNSIAAEIHYDVAPPNDHLGMRARWSRSIRSPRLPWILTAATAALIAGATGIFLKGDADSGQDLIASAQLAPVGITGANGTALLTRTAGGQHLSVFVPGLVSRSGYYEVWMTNPDSASMLALGALSSDMHGEFNLPYGVNAFNYPVVDISYEQLDGNPAHSLVSVVRGALTS